MDKTHLLNRRAILEALVCHGMHNFSRQIKIVKTLLPFDFRDLIEIQRPRGMSDPTLFKFGIVNSPSGTLTVRGRIHAFACIAVTAGIFDRPRHRTCTMRRTLPWT